jgi:hypothetical protein
VAHAHKPNESFNADANTGHRFAPSNVGALRLRLRRRLTRALGNKTDSAENYNVKAAKTLWIHALPSASVLVWWLYRDGYFAFSPIASIFLSALFASLAHIVYGWIGVLCGVGVVLRHLTFLMLDVFFVYVVYLGITSTESGDPWMLYFPGALIIMFVSMILFIIINRLIPNGKRRLPLSLDTRN